MRRGETLGMLGGLGLLALLAGGIYFAADQSSASGVPYAVVAAPTPDQCPQHQPQTLQSTTSAIDDSLVPIPASAVLLCGYGGRIPGTGETSNRLAAQQLVTDRATVTTLRSELNALGAPPSGSFSCPAETGGAVLEIFTGTGTDTDTDTGQSVEVVQDLTGCQTATNGPSTGWVGTSPVGTLVLGLMPARFCPTIYPWATPEDCTRFRGTATPLPG